MLSLTSQLGERKIKILEVEFSLRASPVLMVEFQALTRERNVDRRPCGYHSRWMTDPTTAGANRASVIGMTNTRFPYCLQGVSLTTFISWVSWQLVSLEAKD